MLLSLPFLDDAIPVSITFDDPNPHHLRLASAMAAAGQIKPADLADLSRDTIDYAGIKRLVNDTWWRELAALFEFTVLATDVVLHLPDKNGSDGFHEPDDGHPICTLTLGASSDPDAFFVGRAVTVLEELHAGLGFTALDILDDALTFFCAPCTPRGAYWMAQQQYWQGERDEQEALETYGEDYIADDAPTREKMFEGIPEWAYGWTSRKRLSARDFARSAKRHAAHPLGPLLGFVAQLDALLRRDKTKTDHPFLFCPDYDEFEGYECFEPPAALYWTQDGPDEMGRVFDDYYRGEMESGCSAPYQRFVRFYLDPTEIQESLARLRHTGLMCKALDHALVALRDWEAVNEF